MVSHAARCSCARGYARLPSDHEVPAMRHRPRAVTAARAAPVSARSASAAAARAARRSARTALVEPPTRRARAAPRRAQPGGRRPRQGPALCSHAMLCTGSHNAKLAPRSRACSARARATPRARSSNWLSIHVYLALFYPDSRIKYFPVGPSMLPLPPPAGLGPLFFSTLGRDPEERSLPLEQRLYKLAVLEPCGNLA